MLKRKISKMLHTASNRFADHDNVFEVFPSPDKLNSVLAKQFNHTIKSYPPSLWVSDNTKTISTRGVL